MPDAATRASTQASIDAFRWRLWARVFGFRILPAREVVDERLRQLEVVGEALWQDALRPFLPEFAPLFAPPVDAAEARHVANLKAVAAMAYTIGRDLQRAHTVDEAGAHDAGVIGAWMGIAAAVLDFLIDTGRLAPAAIAAHLDVERLCRAMPSPDEGGDDGAAELPRLDAGGPPPELLFPLRAVEQALAGIRARLARTPRGDYRGRLHHEIRASLSRMASSELASPQLQLARVTPAELDAVEAELRTVNTLGLWLSAYVGLCAAPRPPDPVLEGLLRVTSRLGEAGWILDALADIHEDLEAGVWSRVWVEAARQPEPPDLADRSPGGRARALAALERGPVLDRLLARLEVLIDELAREPALDVDTPARLTGAVQLMTFVFLSPRGEPPWRSGAPIR